VAEVYKLIRAGSDSDYYSTTTLATPHDLFSNSEFLKTGFLIFSRLHNTLNSNCETRTALLSKLHTCKSEASGVANVGASFDYQDVRDLVLHIIADSPIRVRNTRIIQKLLVSGYTSPIPSLPPLPTLAMESSTLRLRPHPKP
jgi:hypothetical protein